jgi:hypothetical protein
MYLQLGIVRYKSENVFHNNLHVIEVMVPSTLVASCFSRVRLHVLAHSNLWEISESL